MKKQILFLAVFVLAVFAGTNNSYGQYINYLTAANAAAVGCAPAATLNCASTSDALHPLPGETYTYGVTVDPAISGTGTIHWFVTDEANLITSATLGTPVLTNDRDAGVNGTYVLASGPTLLAGSGTYNDPANATPQISISWKYFDGMTNKVLLVAYVMDNAGCTNNIDVYQIVPSFGFTLSIAGMLDNGTVPTDPLDAKECVSPVESAVYTAGNPGTLAVDYGENWVFFSVNAANFVGSWMPDFSTVSYTGTAGNVLETEYQWAYLDEAFGATSVWHAESVAVEASGGATAAVGTAGECIVVRARINHGVTDELATPTTGATLTVGVNGTMYDPTGAGSYTNPSLKDRDNNPSGVATDPCVNDYTDRANYYLTPRPELTTNTQPANATKDPFIQKN